MQLCEEGNREKISRLTNSASLVIQELCKSRIHSLCTRDRKQYSWHMLSSTSESRSESEEILCKEHQSKAFEAKFSVFDSNRAAFTLPKDHPFSSGIRRIEEYVKKCDNTGAGKKVSRLEEAKTGRIYEKIIFYGLLE